MSARLLYSESPLVSRLHDLALTLARVGVLGMVASMPISRAVFNLGALLMILGWLLCGRWREKFRTIGHDRVAVAGIVLFALSALSLLWAGPLTRDNWSQLQAYSRLLYIPLIITLFGDSPVWQGRAWAALLGGMLFTLAIYLLDIWFEVPGTGSYGTYTAGGGLFYHHIAQGMMLSFLGAYGLHRALQTDLGWGWRGFWLGVALSTLAGLLVVGISRTGQLSVILAYLMVLMTHLPKRWWVAGLLLTTVLSGALVMGSPRTQERVALALQETSSFEHYGERTSVGARLKVWAFAGELIAQAPWLGHGVGSYQLLAHQHFAHSPICQLGVCEQPHNQFILTTVETGVLGLLVLLAFLLAPLFNRTASGSPATGLMLPLMVIFTVTACFDSSLKIQAQSFFFVTTLALLVSSKSTIHVREAQARHHS